jgi:hypothetical protein
MNIMQYGIARAFAQRLKESEARTPDEDELENRAILEASVKRYEAIELGAPYQPPKLPVREMPPRRVVRRPKQTVLSAIERDLTHKALRGPWRL